MSDIRLSGRMQAVADMVIPGGTVADIGCDHACVSIYLIEHGVASKVIASDVRKGPVDIARKNIFDAGFPDRIDIRMGDGLKTLRPGEADSIIIAGLGGMLMLDILNAGKIVADSCKQLVLQPQSDIEKVRKYLVENGYFINKEDMITDAGKYYNILDVRVGSFPDVAKENCIPKEENIKEIYFKFGKYLLENRNEVLFQSMEEQYQTNEKIYDTLRENDTDNARKRMKDITDEQRMISFAMKQFFDI